MATTAVQRGALRVGESLKQIGAGFRSSVRATINVSKDVIGTTRKKIYRTDKQIEQENKKQQLIDRKVEEQIKYKMREDGVESSRVSKRAPLTLKRALVDKPMSFLSAMTLAWIVRNGPRILKELEILTKKVRVFVAVVKRVPGVVYNVVKAAVTFSKVFLQNVVNFNFEDRERKINEARVQLDQNVEKATTTFAELKNVWGKEEKELDRILKGLEEGSSIEELTRGLESQTTTTEPQSPMVGPQPSGGERTGGYVPATAVPSKVAGDKAFQSAVTASSKRLGISEDYLYTVMDFESAGTFDPAQKNFAGSEATGLIQFIPSTARGLGTTTDELARMSRSQQMVYVEKYLKNAGVKPGASLSDLYMSVLFPAAVGKSDDFAVFGKGALPGFTGRAYTQNKGLDKDKSGTITKKEVSQKILDRHIARLPGSSGGKTGTPAQTQAPEAPSGSSSRMSDVLTAKQFNTMNYGSSSPIIKTSKRGMRGGRHHAGIDFGTGGERGWMCAYNSNGTVTYVGTLSGYGKTVIIKFGNVELLFAHLASYGPGIRRGARYVSGTPIGEVGDTGVSAGIHLHFEARTVGGASGSDIDPNPYVNGLTFGRKPRNRDRISSLKPSQSTKVASKLSTANSISSKQTGGTQKELNIITFNQKEVILFG